MTTNIYTTVYIDDETAVRMTGTETRSSDKVEYWGRLVTIQHEEIEWQTAWNEDTNEEINLTNKLIALAEEEGWEYSY